MEKWLIEAKDTARSEAEQILDNLRDIANRLCVDTDWFIDTVISDIRKLKNTDED